MNCRNKSNSQEAVPQSIFYVFITTLKPNLRTYLYKYNYILEEGFLEFFNLVNVIWANSLPLTKNKASKLL